MDNFPTSSVSPFRRGDMRRMATLGFWLSVALVLMVPVLAHAQALPNTDPLQFSPSNTDLTRYLLTSVFGDWTNGQPGPLHGAMRLLNIFALSFGTLMFTYVAVVGTLYTAQDGELLGKKWSSMWIPARFVVGTALLVPLATGYSGAQHGILWLAMMGGGAASQVSATVTDDFANTGKSLLKELESVEYRGQVKTLMRDVLKAEVCLETLKARSVEATGAAGPYGIKKRYMPSYKTSGETRGTGSNVYEWGDPTEGPSGYSRNYCGHLKTTDFSVKVDDAGFVKDGIAYSKPGATGAGITYKDFTNIQAKAVDASIAAMRDLAQRAAKAPPVNGAPVVDLENEVPKVLDAAVTVYLNTMKPVYSAVLKVNDSEKTRFMESAKTGGWVMFGATFFQQARIQSETRGKLAALPVMSMTSHQSSALGDYQRPIFEDIRNSESKIDAAFNDGTGDDSSFMNSSIMNRLLSPGRTIAKYVGDVVSFNPSNTDHPLLQIKDKGDRMLMGISVAYTGFVATYVAAEGFGATWAGDVLNIGTGGAAKGLLAAGRALLEVAGPMLFSALIIVFGVAITMAFVLPSLPFIYSMGSVAGWLMAVFSAIVAAPIWIAGHLHPEGDGFAGRGIGGYMILLETVTRPVFMVMGLIGAYFIMTPLLNVSNWLFSMTTNSMQADSITGLVSIVMLVVIYVSVVFTTIRMSMGMTWALSEKVYTWIGGAHAGFEQAREFGQAGSGAAASGGQATGKTMESSASSALRLRQKKLEDAQRAAAKSVSRDEERE